MDFGFACGESAEETDADTVNTLLKKPGVLGFALCAAILVCASSASIAQKAPKKPVKAAASVLSSRQIADKIAKSLLVVTTQDIDGKPLGQGSAFFYGVSPALLARKAGDVIDDLRSDIGLGIERAAVTTSSSGPGAFVVSNLHVFKRAWTGKVKLVGSPTTYAIKRIVGIDIKHDLCVFEVEGLSAPPLMLADPENLGVGDDIYVGGNPRGLENTLSRGIISGIRKDEGFIQIDAAISPGSSGGPVVDTKGNVVGVASASLSSGQNLNFAVAGSYLLKLRLTWNTSVKETGAFSISDAENDGLVGKVKLVRERVAEKEDIDTDLYSIIPRSKVSYLYNEDGNRLEATTFEAGEVYSLFKTDYDYRGLRSHITVLIHGRISTERRYTDAQNLDIKLKTRYYGITKEDEYKATSGIMVKETSTYDRNGNLTERMRRAADGSYSRTVFDYDDRARCITEKDYRSGQLFATTRYQYKMDALGNWISQLAIVDIGEGIEPIPTKITFREISYH